jgi:glycosyltransferase involved in cell wall biosynthesis
MNILTPLITKVTHPKVSVCVVTYNQENLIAQCLQSLIDQKTNFIFDIIVSDDCSTDGTPDIIREFARQHPDIVKPILHEKNIGAYKNFVFVHQQATGEYIAHVDGDDYALPEKLQKQADFLDQRKECNIVWHRMLIKNEATGVICEDLIKYKLLPELGFDRGDLLRFITIGINSSKMYRNNVRNITLPPFPVMDFFANVEHIQDGKAFFVGPEPLGVYRAGIGIASSGTTTKKILASCFLYFGDKYPKYRRDIGSAVLLLIIASIKNRRWNVASIYIRIFISFSTMGSFYDLFKYWHITNMLRIPNEIRRPNISK